MSNITDFKGFRSFRCPKCKAYIEEPQSDVYQCPACSSFHLGRGGSGHSTSLASVTATNDRNLTKNRKDNLDGTPKSPAVHSGPDKARLITKSSIHKEVPERASSFAFSDSELPSPAWSSKDSSSGHEVNPMDKVFDEANRNPRSLASLSKLSRAKVIRYDRENSIEDVQSNAELDCDEVSEIDYEGERWSGDGSIHDNVKLNLHSEFQQERTINRPGHGNKDIRIDSLTVEPDEEFYMHGSDGNPPQNIAVLPRGNISSRYAFKRGEVLVNAEMQKANDSPRSAALIWRGKEENSDSQSVSNNSTVAPSANRNAKSRRTRTVSTEIKGLDRGYIQTSTLIGEHQEGLVMTQNRDITCHIQLPYQILIPATVVSATQSVESGTPPTCEVYVHDTRDPMDHTRSSTFEPSVSTTPQPQSVPAPLADSSTNAAEHLSVKQAESSVRMPKSYPPLPCKGAPPYIMCEHCYEVLQVPSYLPPKAGFRQRLQCGACQEVSKFYVPIKAINLSSKSGNSNHDDLMNMSFRSALSIDSLTHEDLYKYSPQRFHHYVEPDHDYFSDASGSGKLHYMQMNKSSSSGSETSPDESYYGDMKEMASQSIQTRQNSIAPGSPLIDHLTRGQDLSPRSYKRLILQISMSKSSHMEDPDILEDTIKKEPEETATQRSSSVSSSLYHVDNGSRGSTASPSTIEDVNKGGKSSYSGLMKAIKDFGGVNKKWIVNGHILKKEVILRAQQKAGVIHPGSYWYDHKAGFWGVMGEPCQGIIMPSIEEFNFPISHDCSGGRTGVYVNGRELHDKDIDLLSKRGLPRTYGKSYDIDIFGNVKDASTGQNLKSLGTLAPSVLKRGRGCGMSAALIK